MRARCLFVTIAAALIATAVAGPASAGTWTMTGSTAVPRAQSHTLITLADGRALVAGGLTGGSGTRATRTAEIYDPATGAWARTGDLNIARSRHDAALLGDGRVLVFGGIASYPDGSFATTGSAEVYDPATEAWTITGSMTEPRYNFDSDTLADGRVLATGGGRDESAPFTLRSAEAYDPGTGRWSSVAKLVNSRYLHAATSLGDGRVLVSGGAALGHCTARDTAEVYDPVADDWSPVSSMPEAHSTHIQKPLPDGGALVAGGWSLPQRGCSSDGRLRTSTTASNVFEPLTGTWAPTGELTVARAAAASTTLTDGRVLAAAGVIGGEDRNTRTATAEIFDPALGAWAATGSLTVARSGARATTLADGRVLVLGGNASTGPQSSAEVFTP